MFDLLSVSFWVNFFCLRSPNFFPSVAQIRICFFSRSCCLQLQWRVWTRPTLHNFGWEFKFGERRLPECVFSFSSWLKGGIWVGDDRRSSQQLLLLSPPISSRETPSEFLVSTTDSWDESGRLSQPCHPTRMLGVWVFCHCLPAKFSAWRGEWRVLCTEGTSGGGGQVWFENGVFLKEEGEIMQSTFLRIFPHHRVHCCMFPLDGASVLHLINPHNFRFSPAHFWPKSTVYFFPHHSAKSRFPQNHSAYFVHFPA